MDSMLEIAKFRYRVIERRNKKILMRAPLPNFAGIKMEQHKWEIVHLSTNIENHNEVLIKKIDDFFGTDFQSRIKQKQLPIFIYDGYNYRIIKVDTKNHLQRCKSPQLSYTNSSITSQTLSWETVHNGDKLLVTLTKDILRRIDAHFNTSFAVNTNKIDL